MTQDQYNRDDACILNAIKTVAQQVGTYSELLANSLCSHALYSARTAEKLLKSSYEDLIQLRQIYMEFLNSNPDNVNDIEL